MAEQNRIAVVSLGALGDTLTQMDSRIEQADDRISTMDVALNDTLPAKVQEVDTALVAVSTERVAMTVVAAQAQDTANLAHGTLLGFQSLNDLSFAYDAAFSAAGLMLVTEGWAVRPVRGAAAYDIESATSTAPLRLTPNGDGTWDLDVDDTRFTTVTSPSGEVTITRTGAY